MLKPVYARLLLVSFILISTFSTYSQSLETKIDSLILSEFNDKDGPGGVSWLLNTEKQFIKRLLAKPI
ncbi:hypothetical protein [Pedobacter jamesrossensis]|uniref:Uncharacterized protein n=1 Tax=Pedobacter jamesrossensis TaxID=1908238 RepID=A0ABV8NLY2_9SPHI